MVAITANVVSAEASMAMVTMSTPMEVTTSTTVIKETTVFLMATQKDMVDSVATLVVDMAAMVLATVSEATVMATVLGARVTATLLGARVTAPDTAAMAPATVARDRAATAPMVDPATVTVKSDTERSNKFSTDTESSNKFSTDTERSSKSAMVIRRRSMPLLIAANAAYLASLFSLLRAS